jgi:hypothetical protein
MSHDTHDDDYSSSERPASIGPNRGLRMKTSTLFLIISGAVVGGIAWSRLEFIVASQGEKLMEVVQDVRDIKRYFGVKPQKD